MQDRKKVLLYNPKAVFFDMPLALLAIGSALDNTKYEVIIVDGRVESNPIDQLRSHAQEAVCLGVTVITGAPIKDALEVCAEIKKTTPTLPVVWGGWHTSLFALEPLEDSAVIDITVQGQGEATFVELVEHLAQDRPLDQLQGISFRKAGSPVKNPARPMVDMDSFQRINYDFIDVEKYFEKKQRRQFDYISSIGCFFRCAFCADPFVFNRKFSAITPEKMVDDLAYYQEKYQFTDVNFQDETFFTYAKRIQAFAQGILDRGLKFSWAATMRADQGERLPKKVWELCKESGMRRVLIGVESGSQEMMDRIKKDVNLEQVFHCADLCKELGISVIFPFIVGFPGESDASIDASVNVIKKLRKQSTQFSTPIFYFKPYPGSSITTEAVKEGFQLPETMEEWGEFDYIGSSGPWVSKEKEAFFENFKFYLNLGFNNRKNPLLQPLKKISQWRCEKSNFRFPVERVVAETLFPKKRLS